MHWDGGRQSSGAAICPLVFGWRLPSMSASQRKVRSSVRLGPPGSEEGCQGHFAVAALFRASPAADFPADYQVAQTPFGGIIVRWGLRVRHEDEQLPVSSTGQALAMPLNPAAQFSPDGQRVFQERQAQRQQPVFQRQLPPGWGPSRRRPLPGLGVEPLRSMSPPGQYCVFRVQRLQRVNVPQQSLPPTPIGGGPNTSV